MCKLALLLLLPAVAVGQLPVWAYPTGLTVTPTTPSTNDTVTIHVTGSLPSGCYSTPTLTLTAATTYGFLLNVNTNISPGPCTLALIPYSVSTTLGPLPAGVYTVTVTYSENGVPVGGPTTVSFSVSPAIPVASPLTLLALSLGLGAVGLRLSRCSAN